MSSEPENPTAPVNEANLDTALQAVWPGLRAYVVSMLGAHRHLADDVLQETALFVWEKRSELPEVRNFNGWVFKAAYFKTQSCRRDLARKKETVMSNEIFELIAEAAGESEAATEERMTALRACISSVSDTEQRLLERRYSEKQPVAVIAAALKISENLMSQRLSRLRRFLRNCVEQRLASGEAAT